MSDESVFTEVQAVLLNSDCDPVEAGVQGLCALYTFVATETEGSPLDVALTGVLTKLHAQHRMPDVSADEPDGLTAEYRKELRDSVLALRARRARK